MRKNLINVSCLFVFTLLFNFKAIAVQEANLDVLSRKFTYHSLTGYERSLFERFIAGDTLKHITAMVHEDWMMGGLWGNRRVWNQIKAGTIHWNNPEGETEWLLVPGDGKTNVRVTTAGMYVYLADEKSSDFSIYVYSKDLSDSNFSGNLWKFQGMKLAIHSTLKRSYEKITDPVLVYHECAISEEYPAVMKITFKVPPAWKKENSLIEIIPAK